MAMDLRRFISTSSSVFFIGLTLSNIPTQVNFDQDFTGQVVLDCSNCSSDTFLRGVFFKEGSNTYFGFTQNNNEEWINDVSNKDEFFHVSHAESSSWSGQLNFRFDPDEPGGNYLFKVGRYTSGSDSSADWSNSMPITVSNPPTPTPVPTSPPTPTSHNPSPIPPTHTPIPVTSTPKPTQIPPTQHPSPITTPIAILAAATTQNPSPITPTPTPPTHNPSPKTTTILPILVIIVGLGLLGTAGYLWLRKPGEYT